MSLFEWELSSEFQDKCKCQTMIKNSIPYRLICPLLYSCGICVHMCTMVHTCGAEDNLRELLLSFHCVGSSNQTQATMFMYPAELFHWPSFVSLRQGLTMQPRLASKGRIIGMCHDAQLCKLIISSPWVSRRRIKNTVKPGIAQNTCTLFIFHATKAIQSTVPMTSSNGNCLKAFLNLCI